MDLLKRLREKAREIKTDIKRTDAAIRASRLAAHRAFFQIQTHIDSENFGMAKDLNKTYLDHTHRADMLFLVKKGLKSQQKAIGKFIARISSASNTSPQAEFEKMFNRAVISFLEETAELSVVPKIDTEY